MAATVSVTILLAVGLDAGEDVKPLQDASIDITRNKGMNAFSKIFTFCLPLMFVRKHPTACLTCWWAGLDNVGQS